VAQADLPGITDEQVQPQHHDGINGNQVGQTQIVRIALHQRPDQQQDGQGRHCQPGAVQVDKIENVVPSRQHDSLADHRSIIFRAGPIIEFRSQENSEGRFRLRLNLWRFRKKPDICIPSTFSRLFIQKRQVMVQGKAAARSNPQA
jgi:hypothetical protein